MITAKRKKQIGWASLSVAPDNSCVVGVRQGGEVSTIHFISAEQLEESLSSKQLRVKQWIFAVPRSLCILKQLSLPASSWEEALAMVEFELPNLVPIPPEELVYSCLPLATHENVMNVLVSAVKATTLETYLQPFSDIGIEPRRIVMSSMGLCHWAQRVLEPAQESLACICAALNGTRGEIVTANTEHLYRASCVASPTGGIDALLRLTNQEILSHRQQLPDSDQTNSRILLIGSRNKSKSLEGLLSRSINGGLIHMQEPPRISQCDSSLSDDSPTNSYELEAITSSGLVTLAENVRWPLFNLVSSDKLKMRDRNSLRRKGIAISALAFLSLLSLWACLAGMNWRTEKLCNLIQAEIAPIEHTAGDVEAKQQQLKAVQRQLANREGILTILQDLFRFTPKNVSLSELAYTSKPSGDVVSIKGQADSLADAFGYTEAMEKAEFLNAIQIENAQQVTRLGNSVVEFRAHCVLRKKRLGR